MSKICDHTSVGVIIKNGEQFCLIKRENYPVSYAFVAGHLDGDTPEAGAKREAQEEVGIHTAEMRFVYRDLLDNPCKRNGGAFHQWTIFESYDWKGTLKANSDAADAFWCSYRELYRLAQHTFIFADKLHIFPEDLRRFTHEVSSNPAWIADPGLEPAWFVLLNRIGILPFYRTL